MTQLEDARARFAADWHDLRRSIRKETGLKPQRSTSLVWPVLALAVGVAVGAGFWWRQGKD